MRLFILFLAIGFTAHAADLTTTNFILRDSAITIVGGRTDATSFQNISAGGQVVAGESSATNFTNQSGILYFTLPTASTGGGVGGGGVGGGSSAGNLLATMGWLWGVIWNFLAQLWQDVWEVWRTMI